MMKLEHHSSVRGKHSRAILFSSHCRSSDQVGCANLKAMYLARCRFVDDWFCARLANAFSDQLLFLDLSGCSSIGATGILALSRLKSLKKLRLYNLPEFEGKQVATMIFENEVPDCLVEGVEYETPPISGLLTAGETEVSINS